MAASVADVAALEAGLTPALLQQHHGRHIREAPIALLDGNLSPSALQVCPYRPHPQHLGLARNNSEVIVGSKQYTQTGSNGVQCQQEVFVVFSNAQELKDGRKPQKLTKPTVFYAVTLPQHALNPFPLKANNNIRSFPSSLIDGYGLFTAVP